MSKLAQAMLQEISALPEEDQERILRVVEEEVRKTRQAAPVPKGRWARLADRLSRESPLEGKSEEFLRQIREFREGFMFTDPKKAD